MEQQIIEFTDCRLIIVDEPDDLPSDAFMVELNKWPSFSWSPWTARISDSGRCVVERSR